MEAEFRAPSGILPIATPAEEFDVSYTSRQDDIDLARRSVPKCGRAWQNLSLRLMVVGESGMGKTTFIENVFHAYRPNASCAGPHATHALTRQMPTGTHAAKHECVAKTGCATTGPCRPSTKSTIFLSNPDELCTSFVVEDAEERIRMHYYIQDTPGYGDTLDPTTRMTEIIRFIQTQNQRHLQREVDMSTDVATDPRIDVCLYFIPPHRLKEIDVEFMRRLANVVALIPIVAKADSMTTDELAHFRHLIRTTAMEREIRFHEFSARNYIDAGIHDHVSHGFPVFAVVSSDMYTTGAKSDVFWPVRCYQWGTCEAFNRSHSDTSTLKRLLLECGYHDVKESSSSFYQAFKDVERRQRTETLPVFTPSQVVAVVFATMAMVTMLLSFGQLDSIRLVFMMLLLLWVGGCASRFGWNVQFE